MITKKPARGWEVRCLERFSWATISRHEDPGQSGDVFIAVHKTKSDAIQAARYAGADAQTSLVRVKVSVVR